MNLKALFNLNYFKENIKKSKGILAFLFGIVPLLNILILIICLFEKENILEFSLISSITHIGMYIIPIALAVSLFGFLFKQKSVDFVMSKPLSRKTVYFTNTAGGILILFVFLLINTLIYGLFGILFNSLVIPFKLLLDYFIFYFISYVFMYSIISLGIAFSGNFITSLVILFIVILLYPFITLANGYLTNSYSINYINCTEEACKPTNYECYSTDCKEELKNNNYFYYLDKKIGDDYTTPVRFTYGLNNIFSSKLLIKMFILSIIYLSVGYFIFQKRKMEENEISFRNEYKHYIVKSITLLPVCIITYFLMKEIHFIGLLIGIAIAFIYYIVYDLITRKEIYKFGKSLLIFIISFGIYNGMYAIVDCFDHNHILKVKDIDSVVLFNYGINIEIDNKKIINKIMKVEMSNMENMDTYYDSIIKTKNGKYITNISLSNDNISTEVKNYIKNEMKEIVNKYNYNNIDAVEYRDIYIPVTKELKSLIKESLNNFYASDYENLIIYNYNNHKYETIRISVNANKELYKYVIEYANNIAVKDMKNNSLYRNFYLSEMNSVYFTEFDNYIFDYVLNNNFDAFVRYVENNNKIYYTNSYLNIEFYGDRCYRNIRINDVESFKKEFDSYKEKLKNEEEYKNLIERYKQDNEVKYEY